MQLYEFWGGRDSVAASCCFGTDDNTIHRWTAFIGWQNGSVRLVTYSDREGTFAKKIESKGFEPWRLTSLDVASVNSNLLAVAVASGARSGYIEIHRDFRGVEEARSHIVEIDSFVNSVRFKPGNAPDSVMFVGNLGVLGTLSLVGDGSVTLHRTVHARNPIMEVVPISENVLVTASLDHKVAIIDLRQPNGGTVILQANAWVYTVDAHEGSTLVACGSRDRSARTVDLRFPGTVRQYMHEAGVTSCALSVEDELLLTGSSDHTVAAWRPGEEVELERIADRFTNGISSVDLSENRQLALVASYDGTGRVFDLAHRQRQKTSAMEEETRVPSVISDRICGFLW